MDKSKFSTDSFLSKVEKPWGYELIFAPLDSPVMGKILHVNAGARLSLQYHEKKEEVLCLLSGRAKLTIEDGNGELKEIEMEPKKGYFISFLQKHRVSAVSDCDLLEASTKEEGKTVRLEDDYGRGTETEEERKEKRGPEEGVS